MLALHAACPMLLCTRSSVIKQNISVHEAHVVQANLTRWRSHGGQMPTPKGMTGRQPFSPKTKTMRSSSAHRTSAQRIFFLLSVRLHVAAFPEHPGIGCGCHRWNAYSDSMAAYQRCFDLSESLHAGVRSLLAGLHTSAARGGALSIGLCHLIMLRRLRREAVRAVVV